jgi:hypothetical protein
LQVQTPLAQSLKVLKDHGRNVHCSHCIDGTSGWGLALVFVSTLNDCTAIVKVGLRCFILFCSNSDRPHRILPCAQKPSDIIY